MARKERTGYQVCRQFCRSSCRSPAAKCNDPFGSRPEPGAWGTGSIHQFFHGEVPEGRARGDQDTATPVQSESER